MTTLPTITSILTHVEARIASSDIDRDGDIVIWADDRTGDDALEDEVSSMLRAARFESYENEDGDLCARAAEIDSDEDTDAATTAAQIAARYNDDGATWRDSNDLPIWEACEAAGAKARRLSDGSAVYTFADESAIVVLDSSWDIAEMDGDGSCWRSTGDPSVTYGEGEVGAADDGRW